jgi:hypothetical protein
MACMAQAMLRFILPYALAVVADCEFAPAERQRELVSELELPLPES